jgi:molybdenum cofactor synthesis domain-containing protein
MLRNFGYVVEEALILPDEFEQIKEKLITFSDLRQVNLIVTTGGTGFAPRDITPEATLAVSERAAPGIAEAIRCHSMQITGRAMFSRAASVIRGNTLIINLPGGPKAVRESLEFILPHLEHGLEILLQKSKECAR